MLLYKNNARATGGHKTYIPTKRGGDKCNPSSLLNHRLIRVTFLTCQSCVQSDFTKVRFGPRAKIKFRTRTEPTISAPYGSYVDSEIYCQRFLCAEIVKSLSGFSLNFCELKCER